ncbi:MAG: transporter associated domain-containing protein, partial [Syntrophaceae bacterium]|nr:transporter associated domain-containing protein [Syntrophaceae bacterium]
WLVDGACGIEKFKEILGLSHIPGEESHDFHTVVGLVMVEAGKIPVVSDSFEWNGFRIEVVDMDANRIDKILVSRIDNS